ERGVDGADDVEEGVAALDFAAERALEDAQLRRQIEAWRLQRDLAGAAQFRSAFPAGSDRMIERDRHPRGSTGSRHPFSGAVPANIPYRGRVTACHIVTSWHTIGVFQ